MNRLTTPAVAPGLTAGPTGTIVWPNDPSWDAARTPWVLNKDQQPEAVALVHSVEDVSAVVTSAAALKLRVMAQGTGHGAGPVGPLTGTVLLRTGALNDIEVDPLSRTAWVGAGCEWQAVTAAAARHGLAVQAGSAPDVGVAGYLLSGGLSWLCRSLGMAVNDVLAVEIVGADGVARTVNDENETDLFWAVRGGGGGFGIVTRILLRLHRVSTIVAGTLFFPMPRAGEVLHAWRRWTRTVPDRTTSCGRLLQLPPLPELPEQLRGKALTAIEVAHHGDLIELDPIISPLRQLGPELDTITPIPAPELANLHMDPPGPTPATAGGLLLSELPPAAIDALIACAGHGSGSPLLSVELRHLGGAVADRPANAGAVGNLDGQYIMFAVGITPDPATEYKVDAHIRTVHHALSPWTADLQYANFTEQAGGRERFHDSTTLQRLQRIKAHVDPTAMFTGAHPLQARSAALPTTQGQLRHLARAKEHS